MKYNFDDMLETLMTPHDEFLKSLQEYHKRGTLSHKQIEALEIKYEKYFDIAERLKNSKDSPFIESLRLQFAEKKYLTPKQLDCITPSSRIWKKKQSSFDEAWDNVNDNIMYEIERDSWFSDDD